MSIAEQILRINNDKTRIRNKLIELSLATDTDDLDTLTAAIESIEDLDGADASLTVKNGETITIPKGYYDGTATVTGIDASEEGYELQPNVSVTPSKTKETVTPDDGYYGLTSVTVEPIPAKYQDVTPVTATASDVHPSKVFVTKDGQKVQGSMPVWSNTTKTLDTKTTSHDIAQGYHDGTTSVKIETEEKSATPGESAQDITPTSGKVLSKVTVGAIPEQYQTVYKNAAEANAEASQVLEGQKFVDKNGELVTGTMPNRGSGGTKLDVREGKQEVLIEEGYYTGGGKVVISLEEKSATPTKEEQNITPTAGKVLSKVTVAAIPDNFIDTTDATAIAAQILDGETAYVDGVKVSGTMANNGAVSKKLDAREGNQSFAIPEGYHNGGGAVGISLEETSATPTKEEQNITPTAGKVLSKVTVAAIPDKFVDTSDATATADQILKGATAYVGTEKITGTMPIIGNSNNVLDATSGNQGYTIPEGYHAGGAVVRIVLQTETATPKKEEQVITPTAGKVLSKVTVAAIPAAYQDVTSVDAEASHVLAGKTIVDATGAEVTGTMANNGAVSGSIDGLTTLSYTIPAGYHNGSGTVTLTSDIEEALAAI